MADQKITDLTALTGANLATGDEFVMVDVSDTTMDATGTDKKMTAAELATGIATVRPPSRSVSDTHTDQSAVNTTANTTVATQAVPTTAAPGDILRLTAWGDMLNNTGSSVSYTWRAVIGATTVLISPGGSITTSALRRRWRAVIEVLVVSTTDERLCGEFLMDNASSATWGIAAASGAQAGFGRGTATEDLTTGVSVAFAVQMGTASASADFVCHESYLQIVKR